jgi:hypothetical protein
MVTLTPDSRCRCRMQPQGASHKAPAFSAGYAGFHLYFQVYSTSRCQSSRKAFQLRICHLWPGLIILLRPFESLATYRIISENSESPTVAAASISSRPSAIKTYHTEFRIISTYYQEHYLVPTYNNKLLLLLLISYLLINWLIKCLSGKSVVTFCGPSQMCNRVDCYEEASRAKNQGIRSSAL